MKRFSILSFDTQLFGFKVAKIHASSATVSELMALLAEIKEDGVTLCYWASETKVNPHFIQSQNGFLADHKTTYAIDFRKRGTSSLENIDLVRPYHTQMAMKDMQALSLDSGLYSRFAVDPRFPRHKFIELYSLWIEKSLSKELSLEVLTIPVEGKIAGMVTLGKKNSRGDIGLISVNKKYRGKSFGTLLVSAANNWFIKNGFSQGQVVTQGNNIGACRLYEKCGYHKEKLEFFYHFWL